MDTKKTKRRAFLLLTAQSVGLATMGGLVWSAYLNEAKASPLVIRPPGALKESEFLKACIKCGQCVVACPYDTLKLATAGDHVAIGTPYFTPRDVPCYMCTDIPCVPVCPTGALDEPSVSDENGLQINNARMGLAVVDMESCVAFWGIQCDACYRACPLMGKALYLVHQRNDRTGKHALLLPEVSSDYCTGCGLCERACITKKPAIFVRPYEVVQGEVGDHYIKGWADQAKQDEIVKKAGKVDTRSMTGNVKSYLDDGIDYE